VQYSFNFSAMTFDALPPFHSIGHLVFDVETTGLPKNWKAPVSDLQNWPRIIQMGWLIYDSNSALIHSEAHIIKPNGFTIPGDSVAVHGISQQQAQDEGIEGKLVFDRFSGLLKQTDTVIAHNLNFDQTVLQAEFLRYNIKDTFKHPQKICTKVSGTDICKLPGKYGYKWPSLAELSQHLFGESFQEKHEALYDATAAANCYFEMKKQGVLLKD